MKRRAEMLGIKTKCYSEQNLMSLLKNKQYHTTKKENITNVGQINSTIYNLNIYKYKKLQIIINITNKSKNIWSKITPIKKKTLALHV